MIVNAVHKPIAAIDALHAHSRSSNNAVATPAAAIANMINEQPPPIAIPVIAVETGSREIPPVITMNAIQKAATQLRASIAATLDSRTAITVTPVGRFIVFIPVCLGFRNSAVKVPQPAPNQTHDGRLRPRRAIRSIPYISLRVPVSQYAPYSPGCLTMTI